MLSKLIFFILLGLLLFVLWDGDYGLLEIIRNKIRRNNYDWSSNYDDNGHHYRQCRRYLLLETGQKRAESAQSLIRWLKFTEKDR